MKEYPTQQILMAVCSLLIIMGVLGPWLWRGFDPYQEYDPKTGERILIYGMTTKISPFYISVNREGSDGRVNLFYSTGTTLSGIILISSALLFPLKGDRLSWIKGSAFLLALFGLLTFFLSLGGGLWLGIITRITWGLQLTMAGISLMLLYIIFKMFS
jgi:hypothetical protein